MFIVWVVTIENEIIIQRKMLDGVILEKQILQAIHNFNLIERSFSRFNVLLKVTQLIYVELLKAKVIIMLLS